MVQIYLVVKYGVIPSDGFRENAYEPMNNLRHDRSSADS